MHSEKSSTSHIGFYSMQIWMFPWQFDKIKRKFLFAHQLNFYENKMILVHHTMNFFICNTKQEINLNLPYYYQTLRWFQHLALNSFNLVEHFPRSIYFLNANLRVKSINPSMHQGIDQPFTLTFLCKHYFLPFFLNMMKLEIS